MSPPSPHVEWREDTVVVREGTAACVRMAKEGKSSAAGAEGASGSVGRMRERVEEGQV